MPFFTLWRSFDPAWTDEDFEKMHVRAISGLASSPPVYWHRSFGIDRPGTVQGFCVYEADSLRGIERQQRICWIPFIEAREVEEARAATVGLGPTTSPKGMSLFLVERSFPEPTSLTAIETANAQFQKSNVIWMRSFWDAERQLSRCIFAADSEEELQAALQGHAQISLEIAPILEEHPSNFADMYDTLGIRRHWEALAT